MNVAFDIFKSVVESSFCKLKLYGDRFSLMAINVADTLAVKVYQYCIKFVFR